MDEFFGLMTAPISYDWAALLVRIAVGVSLLPWGLSKFFTRKQHAKFHQIGPFSPEVAFTLDMLIELLVPFFLFLGLFTRLAVIPAICSFSIATRVSKGPYFTSPALLYLCMMIVILFMGSGRFSVDYLLQNI